MLELHMNLLCYLIGHEYRITRKVSYDIRELKCDRCNSEWCINEAVQSILPLNDEIRKLHDEIISANLKQPNSI